MCIVSVSLLGHGYVDTDKNYIVTTFYYVGIGLIDLCNNNHTCAYLETMFL